MAKNILLLNGPNLNLLGTREPDIYGKTTLDDVVSAMRSIVEAAGGKFASYQSNHEGNLIDRIHHLHIDHHKLLSRSAKAVKGSCFDKVFNGPLIHFFSA